MTIKQKHYLWPEIAGTDSWFSSHHLLQNLKKCYQEKLGAAFFTYPFPSGRQELQLFLKKNQITSVIIADPRLNLFGLLPLLKTLSEDMEFLIHVIGSPVRKINELSKLKIEHYSVCLLAGSEANCSILEKMTEGPVKYFPFLPDPISTEMRGTDLKNKFIYCGRVSYQKNVIALLDLFAQYQTQVNPNAELSLYGPVCNSNFPTKPQGHYLGMSGELFFLKLSELQKEGHRIHYYGLKERSEMTNIMREHNTFISLSTAEEEDFGMGPYEALSHGLHCVLTDWGGFKGFKNLKEVSLIPVSHLDKTLYLDREKFFEELNHQNHKSKINLGEWHKHRKALIQALDLNFEQKKHLIKIEEKYMTEEYFNEYEQFVSPYWG